MYPYVIFILFFVFFFKLSYGFAIISYILKSIVYYFGKLLVGNLYCLAILIQGGILDSYFNSRNYYYANNINWS
jgi:hypothetical protein